MIDKAENVSPIQRSVPRMSVGGERSTVQPQRDVVSNDEDEWARLNADGGPTAKEMIHFLETETSKDRNAVKFLRDLIMLFGK
jgi:hypothetical protein